MAAKISLKARFLGFREFENGINSAVFATDFFGDKIYVKAEKIPEYIKLVNFEFYKIDISPISFVSDKGETVNLFFAQVVTPL